MIANSRSIMHALVQGLPLSSRTEAPRPTSSAPVVSVPAPGAPVTPSAASTAETITPHRASRETAVPLWFKKEAFTADDFEPDEYIRAMRRYVRRCHLMPSALFFVRARLLSDARSCMSRFHSARYKKSSRDTWDRSRLRQAPPMPLLAYTRDQFSSVRITQCLAEGALCVALNGWLLEHVCSAAAQSDNPLRSRRSWWSSSTEITATS